MTIEISWNTFYGDEYGAFVPNLKNDVRRSNIVKCPSDYSIADVYDDFVATFEMANEKKAARRKNGFAIGNMEIYNITFKILDSRKDV